MSALDQGSVIGSYRIQGLIKQNEYTETYKVVNENDAPYFLKLYILKRTPAKLINDRHQVIEIALLRKIQHANVVSYITDGSINLAVGECQYMVTNYFTGDVLSDKIRKEGPFKEEKALPLFLGVLEGLKCLHEQGICHNDITPSNLMLSDSMGGTPEIIDMGHAAQSCSGTTPFDTMDLDPRYCGNATAACVFNERTDLFSAVAVLFNMLTGRAPWEMDSAAGETFATKMNKMKRFRKANPLDITSLPVSDTLKYVLQKGLTLNSADSYQSVDDLLNDLTGGNRGSDSGKRSGRDEGGSHSRSSRKDQDNDDADPFEITPKKGNGHGFEDIAGMQDLKEMLQQKVIFVIQNKELAEQYKLTPPNGMLLYGPPGCGKTFFAEKFAEQTAFTFILVKASDLASIYVHGSQQKIGKLFKQAEENAPAVLCFDEFDALVPNRSLPSSSHVSGEVNEFLSQLNNCAQRGIFVIATTNRPDMIDPAVLRTGRIDKHIFVPLPDHDARKEMFAIHLKGRPFEDGSINLDTLSDMTEGYIASDIAYIVNDAAMTAAFTRTSITQELIEKSIHETRPSIGMDTMKMYDNLRVKMEGIERENLMPRIGFRKD